MSKTEQPPDSDFTKKMREEHKEVYSHRPCQYTTDIYDLCTRLDRSEAENKVYLKCVNEREEQCDKMRGEIKELGASRKDLLDACEKVQKWLDTSSLQQVLVHYTEDERRHALIMGIATNLERLEAAIAKAKK